MKPVLLDTDIISYFFRQDKQVVKNIANHLTHFGYLQLSVITYYEILNGLYYKDAFNKLVQFETFIALHKVIPLNRHIAKRAALITANLKKGGLRIGHNDILIASTAIENNLTLISNNTKHFNRISELSLDNWMS